jgi:hypothetical protein
MEPGLGVQLFEKVKAHMKWDDDKTKLWFDTKNPLCGGITPREFCRLREDKFVRWLDNLIDENTPPDGQK